MTYRESYMQLDSLQQILDEAERDIFIAQMIGNPDRIKVIKESAEEVINLKFNDATNPETLAELCEGAEAVISANLTDDSTHFTSYNIDQKCNYCGGKGVVQSAPNARGIKKCPYCQGGR